ncbi:MAG: hypothetical protein QOD57_995 [Actinomycetota bacterium]|nr:hypothetical protein [Actinomycetota bacterium]
MQKAQPVRRPRKQSATASGPAATRTAAASEPKAPTRRGRSPMSDGHKLALAEGRDQGRGVRLYLEALEKNRPKRGRKRTPDSITRRLDTIEQRLVDADPLTRLHLIQERINLQDELDTLKAKTDLTQLEEGFIAAAKSYGQRKGISHSAWRSLGVPADVLRKAGITRSE